MQRDAVRETDGDDEDGQHAAVTCVASADGRLVSPVVQMTCVQRSFAPGDPVIVTKPLVHILSYEYRGQLCDYCFSSW